MHRRNFSRSTFSIQGTPGSLWNRLGYPCAHGGRQTSCTVSTACIESIGNIQAIYIHSNLSSSCRLFRSFTRKEKKRMISLLFHSIIVVSVAAVPRYSFILHERAADRKLGLERSRGEKEEASLDEPIRQASPNKAARKHVDHSPSRSTSTRCSSHELSRLFVR